MAELPCFLSWRWAQGQAVTREDSSVPPSTISPTSRLRCGDYRVCHPGMSQGWWGNRGEQAHVGRRDLHPAGTGREQRLGVCLSQQPQAHSACMRPPFYLVCPPSHLCL